MDDLLNQLDQVQEDDTEEEVTTRRRSRAYPNRALELKKELERANETSTDEPKKAGRPATGVKRHVFSVSLETELIDEINQLSKETGLTRTMITEKALNLFMSEQASFYREMLGKK